MADYTPISCALHDELESAATLRILCDIVYDKNGEKCVTTGKIVDLYAKDQVEYLRLDHGLEIRLDQLVKLNDKDFVGGRDGSGA